MKIITLCRWITVGAAFVGASVTAATLQVNDSQGLPLATVMITQLPNESSSAQLDDHGYAKPGQLHQSAVETTRFSNRQGLAQFPDEASASVRYRLRKPGYYDVVLDAKSPVQDQVVSMEPLKTLAEKAEAKASNLWLSAMDFGGDRALKKHFQLNCAFCHQQASSVMRAERSPEQWLDIIERMNGYGARVADDDRQNLAQQLSDGYRELRDNAETIPDAAPWDQQLSEHEITEWPIGDAFSQMHDFILHPNGMVYIGDNLQDRIYEVNPETGEYSVYVVPHEEGMPLGGFLGNRFKTFPKLANYYGVHSFAVSPSDGHIFITPSMQQSLIEFDPESKEFTIHEMAEGYYPHTIRADDQNRIWFTLAVSSQIGMLDRDKGEFKFYNLPARSLKEWVIIKTLPLIFAFDPEERPEPKVDRQSTGVPMPYGIDVAPDGTVWFARLYGNDIGFINPDDDTVTMIKTPFEGPRRMRVDADNNVWIVAFQDSQLVKYEPKTQKFIHYDMPVVNELPYSLNVDRERGVVWVNGNQSDTVFSFSIETEQWMIYPLPRKRSFTRDIEIAEDGSIYTSNSHFPSWQIEDGQPTLIRIRPKDSSKKPTEKVSTSE
jgi:virginiamycin B lyase